MTLSYGKAVFADVSNFRFLLSLRLFYKWHQGSIFSLYDIIWLYVRVTFYVFDCRQHLPNLSSGITMYFNLLKVLLKYTYVRYLYIIKCEYCSQCLIFFPFTIACFTAPLTHSLIKHFNQFSIDCCQNAFASLGGLAAPPNPQLEKVGLYP